MEFYGAFSALPKNIKEKTIATIKRVAVSLHLIPNTMKGKPRTLSKVRGKEFLKRIFFGKLIPLPNEIKDGMSEFNPPVPIPHDTPNFDYKVIYAVARV